MQSAHMGILDDLYVVCMYEYGVSPYYRIEYRYFVRIEVTPHTRSLSNFSEFTYTVLQAGSISEKSCAQVVATPALL